MLINKYNVYWYDTMRYESLTWESRVWSAESSKCDKNKKKLYKKETKTNERHCPLSLVQVQDPWRQYKRQSLYRSTKYNWTKSGLRPLYLGIIWIVDIKISIFEELHIIVNR